jgi:hypothetical protein
MEDDASIFSTISSLIAREAVASWLGAFTT